MKYGVLGVVAKAHRRRGKEPGDVRIDQWQGDTGVETNGTNYVEQDWRMGESPCIANVQRL